MGRVIPHQRGDAIAGADSAFLESICQSPCAPVHVTVGTAVGGVVRPAGDDLYIREKLACSREERSQCERKLHHRSLHQGASERRMSAANRTCALSTGGCGGW